MNKNTKGIITVIAVLTIVGGAWFLTRKTNSKYAHFIVDSGKHSNYAFIVTFDKAFLKEWVKAIKNGAETFEYNGKQVSTQGGSSVK